MVSVGLNLLNGVIVGPRISPDPWQFGEDPGLEA